VGESFEVFVLPREALGLDRDTQHHFPSSLVPAGHWIHLVRSRGKPLGLAMSAAFPRGEGEWTIQNIFFDPKAKKLGRIVRKLDKERKDEGIEAKYFTVPSHLVDGFLLTSATQTEIVPVHHPRWMFGLKDGQYYDPLEFLQIISSVPVRHGPPPERGSA